MSGFVQLWGALPLLVLAALVRWRMQRGRPIVAASLEAAVVFGAAVWIGANLLGQFSLLRPGPLRIAWSLAGFVALCALWRTRHAPARWPRPHGAGQWSVAVAVLALLAMTLARAVLSPPNTVDVLNYHLPRQLHWLQQGSLAPWATVNDRQLMMPPLAELIGVQFLALTGDDCWANLPQWAAYAGLAAGLVVLVRRLGGSRGAAGVAALLGLLLPMAYHEASNAKNDLLSACWIVAGAAELARWQGGEFRATRRAAVWLALPLALAWLTKSTAMLFVPPLLVAGLWRWSRRTAWREQLRALVPAALLTVALLAPFHARNLAWYGSPLGRHRAEDGGALAMETFGPRALASNVLRHTSLHLVSPIETWNEYWLHFVRRAHAVLEIDQSDRRTTLWVLQFGARYSPDDELVAGAPLHFVLGLPALLWLALVGRGRARWLAGGTLGGAVLFVALLKWQIWATRLELPLFALGVAAVVAAAEEWSGRRAGWLGAFVVLGAALAWWPGADTVSRPLWHEPSLWACSREFNQYRFNPPRARRDAELTDLLAQAGAQTVSIQSVHDTPYPLMRRLQRAIPGIQFQGGVTPLIAPCDALVTLAIGSPMPLYAEWDGRKVGRLVGTGFGDGVYLPEARVRELGWWDRLPEIGGWARQEGVPRSMWMMPGWGPGAARWLPRGEGRIEYVSVGRRVELRVAVQRTDDATGRAPLQLTLFSDGRELAVIDVGTKDTMEFRVGVPFALGVNHVALRDNAAARGGYVFTRLQLNDAP